MRLLLFATIVFGGVYPLCVWMVGRLLFPGAADAHAVSLHGCTVGLRYVGQPFSSPAYFWSRPSAIPKDHGPLLVSQGSHLPWSSPLLCTAVDERIQHLKESEHDRSVGVPDDMTMASASGIDPEISLNAALFQLPRVAAARGISEDELRALVLREEEPSLLGLFPRRVNVLKLNCELDRSYPSSRDIQMIPG